MIKRYNLNIKFKNGKSIRKQIYPLNFFLKHRKVSLVLTTIFILFLSIINMNGINYIKDNVNVSTFIEDNYVMPNNIFTINIKTLIAIIIYHLVSFIVLNVIGYGSYGVGLLFKILTHSVIMTVFYTSLSYLIFKKINVDKIRCVVC